MLLYDCFRFASFVIVLLLINFKSYTLIPDSMLRNVTDERNDTLGDSQYIH